MWFKNEPSAIFVLYSTFTLLSSDEIVLFYNVSHSARLRICCSFWTVVPFAKTVFSFLF